MCYDLRITFNIRATRLVRGVKKIPKANQIQKVRCVRSDFNARKMARTNATKTYNIISLIETTNNDPAKVVVQPVAVAQIKSNITDFNAFTTVRF